MNNTENWKENELRCSKCGETLNPKELICSISLNMGSPDNNNSLVANQSKTITSICFDCASFILAEEITLSSELMPWFKEIDDDDETDDDEDEGEGDISALAGCKKREFATFEDIDDMLERVSYGYEDDNKNNSTKNSKEVVKEKEGDHMPESRNDKTQDSPENKSADMYFALGHHFTRERDWEHAINSFSRVIELETDNACAYDKRGIAYGALDCYDQAIFDFDAAIGIDDTFAGFYCNRGLSYYRKAMFDEAITDLDKAIELDPDIARFYANRGLAHQRREEYVSAIEDFDKAIELDSNLSEAHFSRGELYADLGEYEKALADFDRELEIDPNNTDAYASRTLVLDEMDKNSQIV